MLELNSLLILMVVVWLGGKFFRRFGLPVIFGELLAGIIVGPTLLGVVHTSETIEILAELGVFFLMLHAGLESDPEKIFSSSKQAFIIALLGTIFPFVGGYFASIAFGLDSGAALFVGMALSVTAIAVTARLLQDYKLSGTKIANLALGAALVDDILSLVIFSVVMEIAVTGAVDIVTLGWIGLKVAGFFGIVLILGQKFFPQINKVIYTGNKGFTFTLIVALVFGLLAEAMGMHVIIGAFLAGLFIREEVVEKELFDKIEDRIWGLSYSFLGPIFFASLAFHLDFLAVTEAPWFLLVIILVAVLGKMLGAGLGAYLCKYKKQEVIGIGVAMNSRGAVELILASIGYQQGIINEMVFSVLVLMAFVTTIISIVGMKPVSKMLKD